MEKIVTELCTQYRYKQALLFSLLSRREVTHICIGLSDREAFAFVGAIKGQHILKDSACDDILNSNWRWVMFNRIKELRKEKGYTQQQVADILGVKRQVYRRYETGERMIPVCLLIRLSELYDVSCDYILELTDIKQHK